MRFECTFCADGTREGLAGSGGRASRRAGSTRASASRSRTPTTRTAAVGAARAAPAGALGRRARSRFAIVRRGIGPSAEALRRGARAPRRASGSTARSWLGAVEERPARPEAPPAPSLPASWDAALATLPADWSDLLGEIELDSSDYVEPGALQLAPINPRRVGDTLRLQFRSASRFGYGASPGMVRRCLERCDAAGMTGRVDRPPRALGHASGRHAGPGLADRRPDGLERAEYSMRRLIVPLVLSWLRSPRAPRPWRQPRR